MTDTDTAQLVFYVLLLIVIGGAVLYEISGRGGRALRQLLLWGVIIAGLTFAADWWQRANAPVQQVLQDGTVIKIPIGRDGHFHLTAQLNGTPVNFMIDTGASSVSLSRNDAEKIGIDPTALRYSGQAVTANGTVGTASITLAKFAIGDTVDRDVRAVVIDSELQDSLLGMSYLRRFARISFEGDMMVLER